MSSPSRLELLLYLNSLGDVVPLTTYLDPRRTKEEIKTFEDKWVPYNSHKPGNRRWGLSLTSLDGGLSGVPDLYSLKEYNERHGTHHCEDQFNTPTAVYHASPSLRAALEQVGPLGRSHILRLGAGGFFPPHRDNALLDPECFRIFTSFNYNTENYAFVLNGKQYTFEAGNLYLINTTLAHSLMSFGDFSEFLVLNLPLRLENIEIVNGLLAQN